MVKPPSFVAGRKYPTVLWIHGGPNGHDEHSLELDGYQFEPQMFAAKGFVVLRVNYRGGSGRGGAYAKAIFADWGHKEVEDLLAGVDHLVALGIADPARLAVGGWSYGGMLTDYTIASDGRFKARSAAPAAAIRLSTYGSDQYVLQYNNELGPPWRNTALWLKVSYPFFMPTASIRRRFSWAERKTSTCPSSAASKCISRLRTLGVPAELVVYPGQHHVFTRPSFVKDLADRMSAWLDRFIRRRNRPIRASGKLRARLSGPARGRRRPCRESTQWNRRCLRAIRLDIAGECAGPAICKVARTVPVRSSGLSISPLTAKSSVQRTWVKFMRVAMQERHDVNVPPRRPTP
jgi:dienelactone hydrolase